MQFLTQLCSLIVLAHLGARVLFLHWPAPFFPQRLAPWYGVVLALVRWMGYELGLFCRTVGGLLLCSLLVWWFFSSNMEQDLVELFVHSAPCHDALHGPLP